jgi:hypothetical protein
MATDGAGPVAAGVGGLRRNWCRNHHPGVTGEQRDDGLYAWLYDAGEVGWPGDGVFDAVIVGGHSFQFMTTFEDAAAALRAMHRHLASAGRIVLHIDNPTPDWLDGLPEAPGHPSPWARRGSIR